MGSPARARRARPRSTAAEAAIRDVSRGGADGIDPVIHARLRLGVMSALAVNASLSFNELKHLLEATDGNLSVHARRLEEAGYISCTKSFDGRLPRSEYRLTARGRRALDRYIEHMEALVRAVRTR